MKRLAGLVVALGAAACSSGLNGAYFKKGEVRYRVEALDRSTWRPLAFEGNDVAWLGPNGSVLAMNATCKDFGDPSLEVLTTHMLLGFTDRELKERKTFVLDGRDALESTYTAKLDGVPIDITVAVLKKDGCVHDFTYVAPLGHGLEQRAALDQLIDGFTTTDLKPQGRTATVRLGTPEVRPDDGEAAPPPEAPREPEAKAPMTDGPG
ncbi:MAG: hypothetical protein IPJ65_23165 [Archangiaceae bacterium]|nr:hypothetical protein [Archangiaceae bacterium]